MNNPSYDTLGQVAIVGISLRVPGAKNVSEFWKNLCDGVDSISHFTDEELLNLGVEIGLVGHPNYVKANGILEDIEYFDADFFGVNIREAEMTDPQHRIFLECAWEALESAGYNPHTYDGRIGVFASESLNSYFLQNLQSNGELINTVGLVQTILGNDRDFLSTRLSFNFNLRGPSVVLQTACSSSLVAVHYACQSLNLGESDMVLAGGVSVSIPQKAGYFYQDGGIYSIDGRCRTFDAEATGTVGGNGVGIVILKRYADALEDNDYIYAVIRGSAVNNDGNAKVGYTAPSIQGQSEVIEEAITISRIEPETISYIEAHGTGTPLGDPIEVEALKRVFGGINGNKKNCAIGSVKSNLGHLDSAAGVVGLIKVALMLKHRRLVPSLHFENPNPKINFEKSSFYVNTENREWDVTGKRRAGVSSFGIGGTNAHLILEEPISEFKVRESRKEKLLVFSANTKSSLEESLQNMFAFLSDNKDVDLADIAYTLQIGRKPFDERVVAVFKDVEEAQNSLRSTEHKRKLISGKIGKAIPEIAFLFPGQGLQYVGMAKEIYQSEPVFKDTFDECAELFQIYIGEDIRKILYPQETTLESEEKIKQTYLTQAIMFSVEYALAKLLEEWGIFPKAMIGHSLGEYVAACLANVFTLDDAIKIVGLRAIYMHRLPKGSMLSINTTPEIAKQFESSRVSLATVNSDNLCVISGPHKEILKVKKEVESQNIKCHILQTSHAFHSPMMNDILEHFANILKEAKLSTPKIPFVSNLTGKWITDEETTSPEYWVNHLRHTVRFADGIKLLAEGNRFIGLEVGPKSLTVLTKMQTSMDVVSAMPNAKEKISSIRTLLESVGYLWTRGYEIDWQNFNQPYSQRKRVALPTYPFERKYCWISPKLPSIQNNGKKSEVSDLQTAETEDLQNYAKANSQISKDLPSSDTRREKVWEILNAIIFDLTGQEITKVEEETTFYELGVDSLLMIQAAREIESRLGIKVSFQQILEEFPTLNVLTEFLSENLPQKILSGLRNFDNPLIEETVHTDGGSVSNLSDKNVEMIIAETISQLQQRLNDLRGHSKDNGKVSEQVSQLEKVLIPKSVTSNRVVEKKENIFIPFRQIKPNRDDSLTKKQQNYVKNLVKRYNRNTLESKRLIQKSRLQHADSRLSLNFRQVWKEMIYPLISNRSSGSKIWDVDGNEYIDLTMGFGVNLFGHSPDFIVKTLESQISSSSLQLGPQNFLANEVSELFCKQTKKDRVAYTVSGTEAVMIAMRLARAVTNRNKIVFFSGSYHGSNDSVLARSLNESNNLRSVPIAPGVTKQAVADTIVLDYAQPESLEIIRENADIIAAVLVEPIQSRRPDLQPKEFLQELRKLTLEKEIILIFDEIITGFRMHPQGCQGLFGIEADLATYGKVIGGGLPIGVVAGKSFILNAIDGGFWEFGNKSFPESLQTYVAGTFYKYPLGMATMKSVLQYFEKNPDLQKKLNYLTENLVDRFNTFFKEEDVPINVVYFGSLFRFNISQKITLGDLFFYQLIEKGVYIWEGRNCFLSTAHTTEDLENLFHIVKDTVLELKENGFLRKTEEMTSTPNNTHNNIDLTTDENNLVSLEESIEFPLTEGQQQIWLASNLSNELSAAYNESVIIKLKGNLNVSAIEKAVNVLFKRHEALRTVFKEDGESQKILPFYEFDISLKDLSNGENGESLIKEWQKEQVRTPFDLSNEILFRVSLAKVKEDEHLLCLTLHHLITDGWSFSIMLNELKRVYISIAGNKEINLPASPSYRKFTEKQVTEENSSDLLEAEEFWLNEFNDKIPVLDLPTDFPREVKPVFGSDEKSIDLTSEYIESLKLINNLTAGTSFVTLLATFNVVLNHISKQDDFIIGIHTAGQLHIGVINLVGYYVNLLPLRTKMNDEMSFRLYLKEVKKKIFEIYKYQNYPLGKLTKKLKPQRIIGKAPIISTVFNSFKANEKEDFGDLTAETKNNPSGFSRFDLSLNLLEWHDKIECNFEFNNEIYSTVSIEKWLKYIGEILLTGAKNIDVTIGDIKTALNDFDKEQQELLKRDFKAKRRSSLRKFLRKNSV